MKNPIYDDGYKKVKEEARLFYSKIDRVWCPVLGEAVVFDETGFRHLVQKGRKSRPKSEQKRRFAFLVHAEEILKNPKVTFSHEAHSQDPDINYWVFKEKRKDKKMKLIVRQIGNGKKHFLSIYGKTQKPTQ
jgi:hypothetical protein